jgi:hypothetical protein
VAKKAAKKAAKKVARGAGKKTKKTKKGTGQGGAFSFGPLVSKLNETKGKLQKADPKQRNQTISDIITRIEALKDVLKCQEGHVPSVLSPK